MPGLLVALRGLEPQADQGTDGLGARWYIRLTTAPIGNRDQVVKCERYVYALGFQVCHGTYINYLCQSC